MDYNQIITDIKNQVYYPVYLLMGEEPYYIDQISNFIASNILKTQEEREFNQIIVYGKDTDEETIISYAKSFSMMANYQVVIVKEAQHLDEIEKLQSYVNNPLASTILVLCYKYGTVDKRKIFVKTIQKKGVLFESKHIYDNKIPDWINTYVKSKGFSIRPEAAMLLAENIGNNLSRLANEIEKLSIILKESGIITVEEIEKNIGISKDFNVFELQNALGERNVLKANKIIHYFINNPKNNPILQVLPMLYSFFSKILLYHTVANKRDRKEVAATLSINPFFIDGYATAARHYSISKLAEVFSYLSEADRKAKGIDISTKNDAGIYKELIFKILH